MFEYCPVCLVEDSCIYDGPSNHDTDYYMGCCDHFICIYCISNMKKHELYECPLCRNDWYDFINDAYII